MITGTYASLLALLLVILSFRVIAFRGMPAFKWFAFGNDGEESLQRAIRGHGNLIEYAPIFLILMLVAEMGGLKETYRETQCALGVTYGDSAWGVTGGDIYTGFMKVT